MAYPSMRNRRSGQSRVGAGSFAGGAGSSARPNAGSPSGRAFPSARPSREMPLAYICRRRGPAGTGAFARGVDAPVDAPETMRTSTRTRTTTPSARRHASSRRRQRGGTCPAPARGDSALACPPGAGPGGSVGAAVRGPGGRPTCAWGDRVWPWAGERRRRAAGATSGLHR